MLCGRALAQAHARPGEPAAIAGYLGDGGAFDAAAAFAMAYAGLPREDRRVFGAGQIEVAAACAGWELPVRRSHACLLP